MPLSTAPPALLHWDEIPLLFLSQALQGLGGGGGCYALDPEVVLQGEKFEAPQ